MDSDPTFLSEEEAARLWQRAAQLQAEAARKAEELAQAADGAHESAPENKDVDAPGGYALTHVRSAALEVGIGSEFMDAALADLRAEGALPEEAAPDPMAPPRRARHPHRSPRDRSVGIGCAFRHGGCLSE